MKNSTKGALMSGLVLPGLGQFVLKRRMRGSLMMLATLAAIVLFVMEATRQAMRLLQEAMAADQLVTMEDMVAIATGATSSGGNVLISLSLTAIIALWLFSMIDAYIIGRRLDKAALAG